MEMSTKMSKFKLKPPKLHADRIKSFPRSFIIWFDVL